MSIPKEALKIIPSKSWKKGMDDILRKTIQFLNNNNYDWSIAEGTLLGKVRHNDYIPWDDDIDLFVSIKKEEVKEFKEKLIESKIPFKKMNFGFQLFGPYLKRPFLDIMLVDKNWRYHNRNVPNWVGNWEDPNFKEKLITSKLRGITIKMPNKNETKKFLKRLYGGDYMTRFLITNHKSGGRRWNIDCNEIKCSDVFRFE